MKKIKPMKMGGEMAMSPYSPREVYPHFSIDLKNLPEAKDWEVGDTYYITLELRQSDMSMHKGEGAENGHVGFDITGIEVLKDKPKADKKYKELPDLD